MSRSDRGFLPGRFRFTVPLVLGLALCFFIGSAGDILAKQPPQWLRMVRGGHHGDYTSVVFEFRGKFSFGQPVVKEREVTILFKDTGTAVAPFRRYKSFASWLRLTKRGRNLEAIIGIPKNFPYVDHFLLSDPERLVIRFSKEKKAAPALEAAAPQTPKRSSPPSLPLSKGGGETIEKKEAASPAAAAGSAPPRTPLPLAVSIPKAKPSQDAGISKPPLPPASATPRTPLAPMTSIPKAKPAQDAGAPKPPSPPSLPSPPLDKGGAGGGQEAPLPSVTAIPKAKPAPADGISWAPASPDGTIAWKPAHEDAGASKTPSTPDKGGGPTPPAAALPKEAAAPQPPPRPPLIREGEVAEIPKEQAPRTDALAAKPKETATAGIKPPPPPDALSKRTYNYRDLDIRQALSALAQDQDINIIMSPEIAGRITIYLNQVTLEEAIGSMAMAGGFAYTKQDGSYYVYKPKQVIDPQSDRLHIRIFRLKFASTEKLQELLTSISGVRTIRIHEASKTIMVEDTLENIAKVEKVLVSWDVAPRQVLIEARIMQVSLTDDMTMGVNWQKVFGDLTLGTVGFAGAATQGLTASLATAVGSRDQFTAALEALQTKTSVNTLSTPKILAIHGKPARVQVGGRQGYKTSTFTPAGAAESISFLDTGTILEITPFIDDGGNVLLEVKPSINSVTIDATGTPNQKTTTVSTSLMAKNGQTVFIGGLIEDTQTGTRDAVPCLGNIPGLGFLFGRTREGIGKTELIVLITPQIQGIEAAGAPELEKANKLGEKLKKAPLPFPQRLMEQTK